MYKKYLFAVLSMAALVITICGGVTPESVAADVLSSPNAATGVQYEIKDSINNGEPITLEYWEWALDRADYEKEWAEEYMKLYPNVTINVSNQSWNDYWTKLVVNVPAGQGPALWHMHTAKLTEFCEGKLMDPMPDSVADQDYLNAHWAGFSEGYHDCPEGTPGRGPRYFVPMGYQMPVLYINSELWEEAGLTEADIPQTWDQLKETAKVLTKYDRAARIIQSGLQVDNWEWMANAVYQQGRYLFTADGTQVQMDNDEFRNALKFIKDLHDEKITDPEFPPLLEAFASNQTAMIVGYSWMTSVINRNNPDLAWFPSSLPTPDGELFPASGMARMAVEAVVNPYASPEEKAVAWDFWHFLYSNDERISKTIALRNGFIPPYDKLLDDPEVKSDKVASVLADTVEYAVLNDIPAVVRNTAWGEMFDSLLVGGASLDEAIKIGEEAANAELSQRKNWNILERNYKYDDQMIPD